MRRRDLDWSYRFWLPLVMLNAGARSEELGQIEVTEVIERCGHPCLHVATLSDADDLYPALAPSATRSAAKSAAGSPRFSGKG